ncbi:hypothetical protein VTK73DRAFT_6295 [Phialemonium thermophilum]|uniref:Protein SDS23 n=1 Tax=Phialemonium thermophilum TaxID=223376 RepID=A0ABR3WKG4_9PEZI
MDPSEPSSQQPRAPNNGHGAGASERSSSQSSSSHVAGHIPSHRQSFAENQRHPPPSPRNQRHPSFTQQALQDLLNHPPTNRHPNPRFAGRDWRDVALGELANADDVRWAEIDGSVEEATMALVRNNPANVVLIRENPSDKSAVSTFDFNDLNAYLLAVVGLAQPDEGQRELYSALAKKAQEHEPISMREVQPLFRKEELITLPVDSTLDRAMEIFGSGIHRVLISNEAGDVVGVLSQLRLVEFFWNEGVHFPAIDRLYGSLLRDLHIGSQQIIAINSDAPLADALALMNTEGLSSVAVVDSGLNVVGNISTADVRLLTNAASLPLLKNTCMHFISVILSERGVERGRDSYPVFHVNPYSTLAHTVAKLVATQSHRMWVVECASPSPSAPATPLLTPSLPQAAAAPANHGSGNAATSATAFASSPSSSSTVLVPTPGSAPVPPPSPLSGQGFNSVPASALPGAHLSGRLTGVVTLTDVLNLFAKSTGLHPLDPNEQRARRRRSSSSSVRPSIDSARASVDFRR